MSLSEVLLFLAGAVGMAHIMVDGKILKPLRDWLAEPVLPSWLAWLGRVSFFKWFVGKCSEMIVCHQCAGLWAGLVVGWLVMSNFNFWAWLATGVAGSFASMSVAIYYNYLEAQTLMNLPPEPQRPAAQEETPAPPT